MKVIVCTMWSPSHQALADISLPILEEYCFRHDYRLKAINPPDNDCWFKKHEAFKEIFQKMEDGDIIWYVDIDTVIMNYNVRVEKFVDDYYPFYLTKDFNELNGGSVIIKNNESGRLLNKIVLENRDMFENEQNLYNSMPFLMMGVDFIKILPQNTINSYSYDLYPECKEYIGRHDLGDFKEGDLLIHFPGLGLNDRIELMKEFSQKIIK